MYEFEISRQIRPNEPPIVVAAIFDSLRGVALKTLYGYINGSSFYRITVRDHDSVEDGGPDRYLTIVAKAEPVELIETVTPSSGNVFADVGLDRPEERLAEAGAMVSDELSHRQKQAGGADMDTEVFYEARRFGMVIEVTEYEGLYLVLVTEGEVTAIVMAVQGSRDRALEAAVVLSMKSEQIIRDAITTGVPIRLP